MTRKSWDAYFIELAHVVAERSTCDRAHVGCVIVKDNRILVTGYNGSLPGEPHCDDVGHAMKNGHCVRTIHAEMNAISQAASSGVSIRGATAYVTHRPCPLCYMLLRSCCVEIVYGAYYGATTDDRDGEMWLDVSG